MNNPPPNRDNNGAVVGLPVVGSVLDIDLSRLLGGGEPHSVQDLRRAMTENTPLTELKIIFTGYFPQTDRQGFVQFLLRYIRSNQNPSLRKLTLHDAIFHEGQMLFPFEHFIMAAAHSETIEHFRLDSVWHLPVRTLVEFFHTNRNVKMLGMKNVYDLLADLDLQREISELAPSAIILEEMVLDVVSFKDAPAARAFESFVSRLEITDNLTLGTVLTETNAPADGIVSSLMKSPVRRLYFLGGFSLRGALSKPLAAATTTENKLPVALTTVEELSVEFTQFESVRIQFQSVNIAVPVMPKLKIIRISMHPGTRPTTDESKRQFLRVVDESSTLTEVQVDHAGGNNFSEQEIQELQARTERNQSLHRLVANPDNFSAQERLDLAEQLGNCPSGLFEIVRHGFKDFLK